jgi:hypothetical protein
MVRFEAFLEFAERGREGVQQTEGADQECDGPAGEGEGGGDRLVPDDGRVACETDEHDVAQGVPSPAMTLAAISIANTEIPAKLTATASMTEMTKML